MSRESSPAPARRFLAVKKALLDDLGKQSASGLSGLAHADSSDPAIALLEAWATIADVLGFSGRMLSDEGYLATAREERSLWEIARLVGYVPQQALAASVHLAFDVESSFEPGANVLIPRGHRRKKRPRP